MTGTSDDLMETKERIKRFIVKVTPEKVLFALKKFHYVHAVRTFSEPEVTVIRRLVKPGDHVIDVGANVGWYTRVLSELVGERGRVYSVEPVLPTFDLLSFCITKLGLTNVELMNYALSEDDGAALMEVPAYDWGGENFYEARIVNAANPTTERRRFSVSVKSLDSCFAGALATIAFVKCDVEGHELAVVKGAQELIAKSRPAWLVEVGDDPDIAGSPAAALFAYFQSQAYTGYWFDGERLNRRCGGDEWVNYFFLTRDHLSRLETGGLMIDL
jgi:FkbM family methyltransferase